AAISPQPGQRLVEIGPGEGVLTRPLLEAVGVLQVVELDRDLATTLAQRLGEPEGLIIHQADALRFDFGALASPEAPLRVVGNLPYNVSTPLLFHLFEHADVIDDMVFMLQKEVVSRLVAEPGGRQYGRLSVMAQFRCEMAWLFDVGPDAFDPPPKVDSAIIRMQPKAIDGSLKALEPSLDRLVRTAFNQKRKTLRNSLKKLLPPESIEAAGVNSSARPETLSLESFLELARALASQ
ncbi:MAG: 16S rRNA (adenine(1518)-N(6)/adenine(1519)-N(6))-dimethyltransferase RsmA, partial [Pseudomonadota bacterium]